jgi:predicted HTH domain antitoxin
LKENLDMDAQIEATLQENEIILKIPRDIVEICREAGSGLREELKLYLAINLYQKALISIGKAAQISGMNRGDFEIFLSKNQIPVSNLTIADVMADIEKIKKFRQAS